MEKIYVSIPFFLAKTLTDYTKTLKDSRISNREFTTFIKGYIARDDKAAIDSRTFKDELSHLMPKEQKRMKEIIINHFKLINDLNYTYCPQFTKKNAKRTKNQQQINDRPIYNYHESYDDYCLEMIPELETITILMSVPMEVKKILGFHIFRNIIPTEKPFWKILLE